MRAALRCALLGTLACAAWLVACPPPAHRIAVTFAGPVEIEPGAPVRYQGVPVGEVVGVSLRQASPTAPARVEVLLGIRDASVTLREADVFEIATDGLMGDTYVRITAVQEDSPALPPGAVVAGTPPLATRVRDSAASALDSLGALARQQLEELAREAEAPEEQ